MWTEWLRRFALAGPAPTTRVRVLRPAIVEVKQNKLVVEPEKIRPQLIQFRG